jgi:cytoskeleton protein RodZ
MRRAYLAAPTAVSAANVPRSLARSARMVPVAEPIGELLRHARRDRGLTLEAASEATKIRARYLRALEAEDWDAMPAPAYARGFLRTYAAYLGLEADSVVEAYRRATEGAAAEPPPPPETPVPLAPGGWRGAGVPWRLVGAIAVVAVVVFLFVLGIVGGGGGGGGGGSSKQAAGHAHHHRHHPNRAAKPPPQPTEASVQIRSTSEVWVCLVNQAGKPLVNGEILPAGQTRGPFQASAFELNLGNGSVQMRADNRDFPVPASSSPLGYRITPSGVTPLDPSQRPTCT